LPSMPHILKHEIRLQQKKKKRTFQRLLKNVVAKLNMSVKLGYCSNSN